jgi:hypothetical protein
MAAAIIARRTFDADEVLSVLKDPQILKTITEGDCQNIDVDVNKAAFIACDVDNELAAVFIFDKTGAVVFDIHAHVLPTQRQKSKDIAKVILKFFFDNFSQAEKLTALIPICYPNVIAFSEAFGFSLEGINRQSYLHQGQLIDQLYLGATKAEVLHGLG